jgi:condensin-2 complex subunit D3
MSRSAKSGQRTLAMEVFRILMNRGLPESVEIDLVGCVKKAVWDQVPGVRAAAINAIAALIPGAREAVLEQIGLRGLPDVPPLETDLVARVIDEKLAVRKAALRCLRALVARREARFPMMALIADRTRDRSLTMRQEAANILTWCLAEMESPELVELWFDSILPLALDLDTKTQELALKLLNDRVLSVIGQEGLARVSRLTNGQLALLRRIFPIYKQKAISLKLVCREIEKQLSVDCGEVLWKLAEILIDVTPEHFKRRYEREWEQRDLLPYQYYAILATLRTVDDNVIRDSRALLVSIADGSRVVCPLGVIHWTVAILSQADPSVFLDCLGMLTRRVNGAASDEQLNQPILMSLIPSIYLTGELLAHAGPLSDYDFIGLQLLISERLPNEVAIPVPVRAIATVALGKLCLWRRDISLTFVSAFAHQLHQPGQAVIKCNCLVVMYDLCVRWSATVDPYVLDLSVRFADPSPVVRRQALLIMTRLVTEDYVKIRPLIVFRFIFSIIDENPEVASFAQSCLFDVLCVKDPDLMSQHFIDSLLYFNDHVDSGSIGEDPMHHDMFRLSSAEKRRSAYMLLISRMSSSALFKLLQASCVRLLQSFVDGDIALDEGDQLLSDALDVMIEIEGAMSSTTATDANTDDPRSERLVEQSRLYLIMVHDQLIKRVLPILNRTHRFLREHRSPLQSTLRKLFRALCARHPDLLDEVKRQEPILGAELDSEIVAVQTPRETPPATPVMTPFRSPLLTRIARTPMSAIMQPPGTPLAPDRNGGKDPPIPFDLDDSD